VREGVNSIERLLSINYRFNYVYVFQTERGGKNVEKAEIESEKDERGDR